MSTTPDIIWGKLFEEVQLKKIFTDNKTFVDAIPIFNPSIILTAYNQEKDKSSFDLKSFVEKNFTMPITPVVAVQEGLPLKEHLDQLWDVLTRKADKTTKNSSLLPLPKPYVVPGGRFREIYYWDSYFTMQGLATSKRYGLIEDMLDNFKWLIENYHHIPNGNRTYYLSRSQPPYYALMVELLAEKKGNRIFKKYFSAMEAEYNWWMKGENQVMQDEAYLHLVKMPDGSILNRYKDNKNAPREESYAQDVSTGKDYKNGDGNAFSNLRSGAESGWDFSSRWFRDTMHLNTIETTSIVPVDLNSLLFAYERILSKAARVKGLILKANYYEKQSEKRKAAIIKYCWNPKENYFFDYNFKDHQTTNRWSAAGIIPLFTRVASQSQAGSIELHIKDKFLKDGGIVTTLYPTGQQWDAPNGWAPIQWITIKGLMNYHYDSLARVAAERWMAINERVFASSGKMLEKYNVENIHLASGGGEYPTQDGFGWSNGVYLKLYDLFKNKDEKQKQIKSF
ncbi:MAG: alpha,alpha-trehalase [Flavisolibacter sp.]